MPRRARIAPGSVIYHAFNRANGDGKLFGSPASYRDFLRLLSDCAETDGMRILAYCAMPNHWHLLLWPRETGDLFRFIHRLTLRHTKRFHSAHGTGGRGHLYQARYKSVPVQDDEHLITVCRYIEQNPLRAGLVDDALDWPWSSAAAHARRSFDRHQIDEMDAGGRAPREDANGHARSEDVDLEPLPVDLPEDWARYVNALDSRPETKQIRESIRTGLPIGSDAWVQATAVRFGIPLVRNRGGRPRKSAA